MSGNKSTYENPFPISTPTRFAYRNLVRGAGRHSAMGVLGLCIVACSGSTALEPGDDDSNPDTSLTTTSDPTDTSAGGSSNEHGAPDGGGGSTGEVLTETGGGSNIALIGGTAGIGGASSPSWIDEQGVQCDTSTSAEPVAKDPADTECRFFTPWLAGVLDYSFGDPADIYDPTKHADANPYVGCDGSGGACEGSLVYDYVLEYVSEQEWYVTLTVPMDQCDYHHALDFEDAQTGTSLAGHGTLQFTDAKFRMLLRPTEWGYEVSSIRRLDGGELHGGTLVSAGVSKQLTHEGQHSLVRHEARDGLVEHLLGHTWECQHPPQ